MDACRQGALKRRKKVMTHSGGRRLKQAIKKITNVMRNGKKK